MSILLYNTTITVYHKIKALTSHMLLETVFIFAIRQLFLSIILKTKKARQCRAFYVMKAVDGFEPTIKLLQSRALPLGYTAITDNILP